MTNISLPELRKARPFVPHRTRLVRNAGDEEMGMFVLPTRSKVVMSYAHKGLPRLDAFWLRKKTRPEAGSGRTKCVGSLPKSEKPPKTVSVAGSIIYPSFV
jgi:hypothetical protein